ncbi:VMAP-C domain-containing protein [Streptomyces sp. NBC_01304]|uniref:VMAP-C domain-containing protein n=1 Tax=Streptomyces sp. NBC_01304 TaxID=2903818 RepID=UPI002E15A4C2|nr:hypothetical protein OG430_12755 [Streptomyces sp. NBC_01304]
MPEQPSAAERASQLVDALMKVPVLDNLRSRKLCVDHALDLLGVRLSVADFEERKLHLVQMVKAFGTVPEGWVHLAQAVSFLADYDLPSERAAALAQPPRAGTDHRHRRELELLLGTVGRKVVPELATLFAHSAGEGFGPLPEEVHTAWEAYELLEQCNVPSDGVPRAIRFVQAVAYVVRPELGDALRNWLSRHVRAVIDEAPEALRVLSNTRMNPGGWRNPAPGSAYLVVKLHPCTDSPDHVWLTCWTSSGDCWAPRQRDDRRLPLSEAPAHVATLIDKEEARLRRHQGGIILEFILPMEMANLAVENWTRTSPFGEGAGGATALKFAPPLCVEYKVITRSLERIEALQLHRVWNERWEVLASGAGGRLHRCESGDGSRQSLLYATLKRDPAIVLMTLGSSPDAPTGRAELELALQAGIPALIWAHQGPLHDHERAAADHVADTGTWHGLLDQVARLRSAPAPHDDGAGDSIGSRIAVLWDDPNRLPEVPEPAG